ncbi:hypothetical protein AAOE16_01600 [Ekhidna sp. MALMAid0563]|uniref:hypothetical protein n=1 Tax=Ekhidna sp. MALMAid0563 TaxID=3143937 RepID=UPI0032DEB8C6
MNKILLLCLAILIHSACIGQKTQSLEGMKSTEIRKFLMAQNESEMALEMIKKHNTSRIFSYVFFGSGFITLMSQNPSDEKNVILTTFYGGTLLIAGLITAVASDARLKKAAKLYEHDIQKAELKPNIRSEITAFGNAKYPTPR